MVVVVVVVVVVIIVYRCYANIVAQDNGNGMQVVS